MTNLRHLVWLAVLLFALTACATTRGTDSYTPINSAEQQRITQLRRSKLEPVNTWDIKGRLAIEYANDGFTAGLKWKQYKDQFTISLTDPLGRTAARLNGNDAGVELAAQGKTYKARSATELMRANLGWALPLDSLYHWSKGIPDPNHPLTAVGYDTMGRPVMLIQDGWQVEFTRYSKDEVLAWPGLIRIIRPDFKAKLSISSRN